MFSRKNNLKIKIKSCLFSGPSCCIKVSFIAFYLYLYIYYTSMTLTWKSRKVKVTGFLSETELADIMEADKMLLLMKEVLRLVVIKSSMFW